MNTPLTGYDGNITGFTVVLLRRNNMTSSPLRPLDLADSHPWESGMFGLRGHRSIYLVLSMNTNDFNQEKSSAQLSYYYRV